jgi:hypothetical protein
MSDSPAPRPPSPVALAATGVIWILLYFIARILLKDPSHATWLRVTIALIPIPFFAGFLWQVVRGVRSADEFERRIHLEALAVAYPLAMVLLMTLGLLQRAVVLKFEDWSYLHVWIYLPIFYLLGLTLARRRYA